jgi:hypothetical protein
MFGVAHVLVLLPGHAMQSVQDAVGDPFLDQLGVLEGSHCIFQAINPAF